MRVRLDRALPVSLVLALAGLGGIASCSLSLDESLIDARNDAGPNIDGPAGDGAPMDGGADGGTPGDNVTCTNDDDCKSTHGCLKGSCDLELKRCTYDVCRSGVCSAATCDEATQKCGADTLLKYKSGQFKIGTMVACTQCVAATHPWLFVVTTGGLVAFNVSNPNIPAPPQVPVIGLGFVPDRLVRSGRRIWMTAPAAAPNRLPLAYIDVPADPFAKTIVAHTVLATTSRTAEDTIVYPRGGDTALLVGSTSSQLVAASIEAPLVEPTSITQTPLPDAGNAEPVVVSGKRLLMYGAPQGTASFTVIDNVGGPTPVSGPVTAFGDGGVVSGAFAFGQNPEGAVFYATGATTGGGTPQMRAVRGYFLVANETAPVDSAFGVDVELYNASAVAPDVEVLGPSQPVALLDAKTAMVVTMARENGQQSAVQFVTREPLSVIMEGAGAPRRHVLPTPISAIVGTTASRGIGYVVANEKDATPPASTVYVFNPSCGL